MANDTPASQVVAIVDRLCQELRTDPTTPAGLSLGVGVAERRPHDGRPLDDLVDEADRDMYQQRMLRRLRRVRTDAKAPEV